MQRLNESRLGMKAAGLSSACTNTASTHEAGATTFNAGPALRLQPAGRLNRTFLKCVLMLFLLALVFAGSSKRAAAQTTVVPGCGFLNGPPCSPVDNEFWNIYFAAPTPCDFGLIWDPASLVDPNIPQQCTNVSRQTITPDTGWLGWAMNEQRYNVQAEAPINLVTTLGTHNSYSSYGDGFQSFISTDQKLSIWDQLQAGARYIRLDPDYWYGNERLCHGSPTLMCELTSPPAGPVAGTASMAALTGILGPLAGEAAVMTPGRLYGFAIIELAQWMDANPNELVILDLHDGSSACGALIALPSGDPQCEHNDLLFGPIRDFIGTDRIFIPRSYRTDTSINLPTMKAMLASGVRLVIIGSDPLTDDGGTELALDRSTYYTETMSKDVSTWANCQDADGHGLWYGGPAKFGYASEDRTASVTLLSFAAENYGYINATEVSQAANCGYGIIAIDFLLNQGLSQQPLPAQNLPFNPDTGADHRREASIWSFDQGDTGTNGPAIMKANGRWSSDVSTAVHPYACAKGYVESTEWVISSGAGEFYNGRQTSPCPPGYNFSAPRTGPQNTALHNLGIPAGGIWLNYIGSTANLLSGVTPTSLAFEINAGASTATQQQVSIVGPPNTVVNVNALARVTSFLSVPSQITLDENGNGTFDVNLLESASKLNAGFYTSTLFINAAIANTGAGSPTDVIISHASVSVLLKVLGPDTVQLVPSAHGVTVSNVLEGTPIHVYGQVISGGSQIPPTGALELRGVRYDASNPAPTTQSFGSLPLQSGAGVTTFSYAGEDVVLPPGSYKLGARYPGDVFHLAAVSPAVDFTVTNWLNVSPLTYQLSFPQGSPGDNPQQMAVALRSNESFTATAVCDAGSSPCWLESTEVAGNAGQLSRTVNVTYTPAASTLVSGVYAATITIRDGIHNSVVVPVTLTVTGTLRLKPASLKFIVAAGETAAPQTVEGLVGNENVPLMLTRSSADWLTFKNGEVQVNTTKPPVAGTYQEYIGVREARTPPLSTNEVLIPVTVQVVPLSTVSTSPNEPVTVDGTAYLSPATFAWSPGSGHTIAVAPTITTASGELLFTQWTDKVTTDSRNVAAPKTSTDVNSWRAVYAVAEPKMTANAIIVDDSSPSTVVFQISLANTGTALANGLSILSIGVEDLNGSGKVQVAGLPTGREWVAPGQTGDFPFSAAWPKTATRVQLEVKFMANDGAFMDSQTIVLSR